MLIDSSDNVYVAMKSSNSNSYFTLFAFVLSTGNIIFAKKSSNGYSVPNGLTFDDAVTRIYACGNLRQSSTTYASFVVFDKSNGNSLL